MRKPFVLLAVFVVGLTAAVVAAPVPKGEAKLPPPTGAELRKSKNNLKMIMLAMHNYHDVYGAFPTNVVDGNGKPILSWRVHLLPYLEQDALYKKFKLDEGWDSANNKKLIEEIPDVYAPIRVKPKNKGETFYCGFAGKGRRSSREFSCDSLASRTAPRTPSGWRRRASRCSGPSRTTSRTTRTSRCRSWAGSSTATSTSPCATGRCSSSTRRIGIRTSSAKPSAAPAARSSR